MMQDYQYTECGLDNIILRNMDVITDDAGESVYSIPNVIGLHKVIAHCIITRSHGISPAELRFLRTEMGLTQAELAEIVKKDHQTVGRWERAECSLDQNAEMVIRLVAAERLKIDPKMSVEEIIKRCVPTARINNIVIDGRDPDNYFPLAA